MVTVSPILYQSQVDKFSDIRSDYNCIKKRFSKNNSLAVVSDLNGDSFSKTKKNTGYRKDLKSVLDVFPTFRRLERVPDKIKKSDDIPAAGLVALAVLNGPEDLRDTMSAYKQVKAKVNGESFKRPYDSRKAQHPFSFFRGTLLHNFVTPEKSPFPNLAKWLLNHDVSLMGTSFGRYVGDFLNVKIETFDTKIKNISKEQPFVPAYALKAKNAISDLTVRALARTTKIGAIVLAGIEAAHFAKEVKNGKDVKREILESCITYTSSIAGIGYMGALGAKHFGSAGSIVGMGLGAYLGNKVSSHFDT